MAELATLSVLLQARDKLSGPLGTMQGKLDNVANRARKMGMAFTAMGGAITGVFALAIKSSQEQQVGINRLDQALKNVSTSYNAQRDAIEAVIEAQQRKTNFGDEAQRDALQKLVTIGGKWEGSLEALTITTDVAAGANIDLNAAALLVGKAIAGETSSLSRYGILLEKGATQTEIMAALTKQFAGAAEAAADPFTQLKNRMGDMLQVLGDALLPIVQRGAEIFEAITRKLIGWAEEHPELSKVLAIAAASVGALLLVLGPLLLLLPALAAGIGLVSAASLPLTIIPLAIAAAIAAVVVVFVKWEGMSKKVKIALAVLFPPLAGLVVAAKFLQKNWDEIWPAITQVTETAVNGIIRAINVVTGGIATFIEGTKKVLDALPGKNPFGEAMDAAVVFLQATIDEIDIAARKFEGFGGTADFVGGQVADALREMAGTANSPTEGFPGIARAAESAARRVSDSMADEFAAAGEAFNVFLENRFTSEQAAEARRTGLIEKVAASRLKVVSDSMADELAAGGQASAVWQDILRQRGEDQITNAQLTADTIHRVNLEAFANDQRILDARDRANERTIDAIARGWEGFKTRQDATIQAMSAASLDFDDVLEGLGDRVGKNLIEMGAEAQRLGVNWGNSMELIKVFGRDAVNSVIADFSRLNEAARRAAEVAAAPGSQPGGLTEAQIQASIASIGQQLAAAGGSESGDQATVQNLQRALNFLLGQRRELFGFAQGGSFTVGGGGGVDSQMVAFRATPGGRVEVTPAGRGGGGKVLNFTVINNAPVLDGRAFVAQTWRDIANDGGFADFLER